MQSLIHINECRVQDIQRTTEKQQELEQQQTDLIGEYSKFSDTFSSTIPGVPKVSYSQDLRPNGGTNQLTSSGQYQQHPIFSTSSVLSATSASVNRTTAAPYSYTSMPSSTLGPTSLGNVVVSSENTSSAYQADIASLQVRLKIYNVFICLKQNKKRFYRRQILFYFLTIKFLQHVILSFYIMMYMYLYSYEVGLFLWLPSFK